MIDDSEKKVDFFVSKAFQHLNRLLSVKAFIALLLMTEKFVKGYEAATAH